MPTSGGTPTGNAVTGGQIAAEAKDFLGDPYVWGAAGPTSFDCSGLVQYTLGQLGIQAPRTSQDQWGWVKRVPAKDATVGDLVFFTGSDPPSPGHVGIIVGPGKMIDAPYTGANVQVDSFSNPGSGDMQVVGYGRVPSTSPGSVASPGGSSSGDSGDGGLLGGLGSSLGSIADDFEGLAKILTWVSLPSSWVRIFAGISGAVFLGAGVWFLMQEAGND
jgi:hypothetical protein